MADKPFPRVSAAAARQVLALIEYTRTEVSRPPGVFNSLELDGRVLNFVIGSLGQEVRIDDSEKAARKQARGASR